MHIAAQASTELESPKPKRPEPNRTVYHPRVSHVGHVPGQPAATTEHTPIHLRTQTGVLYVDRYSVH